jgi:hypothetical protein
MFTLIKLHRGTIKIEIFMWVNVDESTDSLHRASANVVVSDLKPNIADL